MNKISSHLYFEYARFYVYRFNIAAAVAAAAAPTFARYPPLLILQSSIESGRRKDRFLHRKIQ